MSSSFIYRFPSLQQLRRKLKGGLCALSRFGAVERAAMSPYSGRMFQSAHCWAMLEGTAMAVVLKNSAKLKCKRSIVQDL